jgi:transposase
LTVILRDSNCVAIVAVMFFGRMPAMSRRYELTDEEWDRIQPLLKGKPGDPGGQGTDNRLFVNAVIWVGRTGAPWRDLPERFGNWNSVFVRFNRWANSGVWAAVFHALQDPDPTAILLDSTVIRAHQHAAGAAGAEKKSRTAKRSGVRGAATGPSSTSRSTRTVGRSNSASVPAKNTM